MITKYLEKYAEKHDLVGRCRLNTHVARIERESDRGPWRISTRPMNDPNATLEVLRCTKLILSTGHETVPNLPPDLDLRKFTGTLFHAKELGKRHDEVIADEGIKSVAVVGGSKSAFEIAANFGLAGKKVNWLIREDGMGPAQMICDRPNGKDHMMKGMTTRAVGTIAPSLYAPQKWLVRFLYGGRTGLVAGLKCGFGRWPIKTN